MTELTNAIVRRASTVDAKPVAELCWQLGYSASQAEVQQRLEQIQQDRHHAVYVAEIPDKQIVGWVHVHTCQLVIAEQQALIWGLIVDETYRCCGIGQCLMQQAEQWAREKGCQAVLLLSNVTRTEAHVFYEKMDYSSTKTSLVFHKVL